MTRTIKRVLYVLAVVAVVLGIYGFGSRLLFGERDVNYGSYVNWGLWVAMYLFFAGLAAGSFMVATLDYLFEIPLFKGTGKWALWATVVTLPAALVLIGFDLGHMERIWKVYLQPNFSSLLAQLVWSYTTFLVVALATLGLVMFGRLRWLKPVMVLGLAIAIFVSGGVGALLGVNAARVSFQNAMLPAQFPVLNLASGIALLLVMIGFFGVVADAERRTRLMRVLSLAMVVLLAVKAYFLWVDYSQALYSQTLEATAVAEQVLFGPYWWAFWILQLGLGVVVPAIVLVMPSTSRRGPLAGLMGVFVLVGLAVGRTSIIFPALAFPEFEGLVEAFTGPHLGLDYTPSLMEWSVTVGVLGMATLAYLVGMDRLPLFKPRTEVAA
ncbi:MAG TPA: NrfD/PsrC family molybdoenzyme membrane anchor subunit [Candidatus Limnocylindrales bacterium]|nr:NrfD/PsrC family molybdoenzyme membrane anchor subunit [Candidatus Limnocylindrales bacterium]